MTPTVLTVWAALGLGVLAALPGWWSARARMPGVLAVLALAGAAGAAALGPAPGTPDRPEVVTTVLLAALLAVGAGGPVTTTVFSFVDGDRAGTAGPVRRAAEVLRGGAWIGALERGAVFAALAAGWPEGIAITLALKGLGRYPELRHEERTGIAERFLIGTFVSVLWAAACAGVAVLLLA